MFISGTIFYVRRTSNHRPIESEHPEMDDKWTYLAGWAKNVKFDLKLA